MRIIDKLLELQEKLENNMLFFRENIHKQSLSEEEEKGRQHIKDWAEKKTCTNFNGSLDGWDTSKCTSMPEGVSKGIFQQTLDPNAKYIILIEENLQYYRNKRLLNQSRIANRKLRYTKCATQEVKRSKDVEP